MSLPLIQIHKINSINTYLQKLSDEKQFSGIALITQNNEILFHKAFGLANHELDVKNHGQTKFRIASITKQFTASMILKLQELGLICINNSIDRFVPDFPKGSTITIHHLLSNTSGLPRIQEIPDLANILRIPHTAKQMVDLFKDKSFKFSPR